MDPMGIYIYKWMSNHQFPAWKKPEGQRNENHRTPWLRIGGPGRSSVAEHAVHEESFSEPLTLLKIFEEQDLCVWISYPRLPVTPCWRYDWTSKTRLKHRTSGGIWKTTWQIPPPQFLQGFMGRETRESISNCKREKACNSSHIIEFFWRTISPSVTIAIFNLGKQTLPETKISPENQ